jgi:hypothetical protein
LVDALVPRIAGKLRAAVWSGLWLALLGISSACGPVQYAAHIDAAAARLNEARDASARWFAPFDYYYAEAHLSQARREAAHANYEEAITYAEIAERYSQRALRVSIQRGRLER